MILLLALRMDMILWWESVAFDSAVGKNRSNKQDLLAAITDDDTENCYC